MAQFTYKIEEMDCAEEVTLLTRALLPVVGQETRLGFDVMQRKLRVDVSGISVTSEQIEQAVAGAGMRAEPVREAVPSCACCGGACDTRGSLWKRRKREILCLVSGVLWAAGLILMMTAHGSVLAAFRDSDMAPLPARALWIVSACVGAWHVLPRALASLRALRPDMNLLMVLAIGGAMGIGEYSEGASVAFLFALANQLEAWSVGRARNAIEALMTLAPDTALVLSPFSLEPVETLAADVPVGARVLVKPGARIPLDGVVRAGSSAVDQAPITGESVPVFKAPGDPVFAGTVNTDGALEVETTKRASDSTLARIMRMVEEAQSRRAKAVQWVEKFAAVYTPAMVGVSLLVALVPPLFLGGEWMRWVYEALVVLVISCPCALVISTPVSIVAGMASAARNGVLIKGGAFLEVPAGLDAVALDKTGTLTFGRPEVTAVSVLGEASESGLLRIAAALESRSSHPVARAVLAHAASKGITPGPVEDAQSRPGLGAAGNIDGVTYHVGNMRYLADADGPVLSATAQALLERHEESAGTVVAVWSRSAVLGFLSVEDTVRPQARAALDQLKDAGIGTILMLTGDSRRSAEKIARETGVTEVRADLLPEDKTSAVAELAAAGRRVAMVGDGVNDAPALASSHLGVAMGAMGTDAAIETADVALMSDDLAKLPWLIRHSRRTMGIIKANIAIALGIKVVFLLMAVLQVATLWTAVLADLGTSLFVIFNGLRLLRIKQ